MTGKGFFLSFRDKMTERSETESIMEDDNYLTATVLDRSLLYADWKGGVILGELSVRVSLKSNNQ